MQERILFPAFMVRQVPGLPPGAERLELRAGDGTRLEGVRIPAAKGSEKRDVLLVFAGNAENAQDLAEMIQRIFPEREIVAFFYRGYAPSGGRTSAAQLIEDAPLVYDLVRERLEPGRIDALGVSLGSGVAASLTAKRPLDGLILVTPFDSLSATASQLYPWLPVSLLLRHDIKSAETLRGMRVPVALIAAAEDRLIRPERTAALREKVPRLVFDSAIPRAHHNDIFFQPEMVPALREALKRIELEK